MSKFFVPKHQIKDEEIKIVGEDAKHIKNVLRHKIGDEIIVSDMGKMQYTCEIDSFDKEAVNLSITSKQEIKDDNINITLFQGLPKKDKMELIIQKCTEMGVKEIVPIITNRVIVKIDDKDAQKKLIRWQKISEEASKQCMRNDILKVHNIINIKKVIENFAKYDIVLVAYENESKTKLKEVISNLNKEDIKNIAIIIGPEGGLEEAEVETFIKAGAKSVSLGSKILRTETAGIVMSAILIYEFEG